MEWITNSTLAKDALLQKIYELEKSRRTKNETLVLPSVFDLDGEDRTIPTQLFIDAMQDLKNRKIIKILDMSIRSINVPVDSDDNDFPSDDLAGKITEAVSSAKIKFEVLNLTRIEKEIKKLAQTGIDLKPHAKEPTSVHVMNEGAKGYIKFSNQGRKIYLANTASRQFRLMQSLTEPKFGVHKTISAVFDAIRSPKDLKNASLNDSALRSSAILSIIEYTIKELQKKLKGKILFHFSNDKKALWIEAEG